MPELPEVDHARATLSAWLRGRDVIRVRVTRGRPIVGTPATFARRLAGTRVGKPSRRGKHLLVPFLRANTPAAGLHVHLGMTGRVLVRAADRAPRPHVRLTIERADGTCVDLRDPRRFGRVELTDARRAEELADVAALGPDPTLDAWSSAVLAEAVGRTARPIKDVLMDQSRIAGLGNIYAAEALHGARIHPLRPADRLRPSEHEALAEHVTAVLERSLQWFARRHRRELARARRGADAYGGPLYLTEGADGSAFAVYERAGEPCHRCGRAIENVRIAGRSSYFCPGCQRRR